MEAQVKHSRNITLASDLFDAVKDYQFLHTGQDLVSAIIYAVQNNIPSVVDYIDHRFKNTKFRSQHEK